MKTVYLLLSMGILLSCGNSENKISESISNSPTADYIIESGAEQLIAADENKMENVDGGYLELIIGPMFSGKTSKLLDLISFMFFSKTQS
jgi:hypothetical protein